MNKEKSQAFMQKAVGDVATALAASLVHVGDRAGLWRALAGAGPLTLEALRERTGIHPRYLEEWLAAMLCAGYLEHDAPAGTWTLPEEHALFLADPASEYYLGGLFRGVPGLAAMAPRLAEAFASGGGIAFRDYGDGIELALEQMNRNVYASRLRSQWLPTMPQVVAALEAGGSAIDIGCGTGVIPVLLAQAFPAARITGLDIDARSIELARENARAAGVAERVRFVLGPAEAMPVPEGGYDFVSTFDCVHDLPDPQGVLARIRAALAPEGTALMVEPKVADDLHADARNPFARMLYGISCLHCVPQSIFQGGPGLGACWGQAQARRLALDAGFTRFQALPIRSPAQAFYEMRA